MREIFSKLPDGLACKIIMDNINEITLRADKNVVVKANNTYYMLDYIANQTEIENTLKRFCDLSVYAYLDELRNGFITVKGGHRIGVCGTAVIKNGDIYNIKNVNSINIRIANEYIGCSENLDFKIKNLLVVSPPGCGKTTLIRDLCRRIGKNHKVSIVDERGEIAGIYNGIPSFKIGVMTDVLSLVPKKIGIEYVLRSMSPEYIVTDEISVSDCEAIENSLSCGVNIIATAHGNHIERTLNRIGVSKKNFLFENIILLSNKNGVGTIEEVVSND